MQSTGSIDPLDEIGDLVGQTLDILGTSEPYSNKTNSSADYKGTNNTDKANTHNNLLLDEVDILGGGTSSGVPSRPANDHLNPLNSGFVDEDLLGSTGGVEAQHATSDGPHEELLQGPVYDDLERVRSGPAPAFDEVEPEPSTPLVSRPTLPSQIATESGEYIKVTIKEPEKVETVSSIGLKTHYVQYHVRTDSTVPGLLAEGLEVKRRFSDFDSLHKHLKSEYRGFIVPPLPEKSFIQGKMAHDDFIRLRRADLQAFVKALTTHPILRTSEAFKIFLLHPGELSRNPAWTYLVNPPASLKAQRAGSTSAGSSYTSLDLDTGNGNSSNLANAAGVASIKAGLGSWVNWMKQSVAQFTPPKRELSEEEVLLRQQKELLLDLKNLLELAVESARALCAHQEALCGDVKELGRTFAMLSRFEEAIQAKVGQYTPQGVSAANRATDLNTLAYGSVKQHGVWKTLSIKTAASLVTLHDYLVLVPEAISALELREAALNQLHLLQDELASKQHAHEQASAAANKLRILSGAPVATPSPAEKRSYQLTTAIAQLEENIKAAQRDYDTLKSRNQSELARLNLEREVDFRKMMAGFAQTQAELVRASAEMWANLARQYEPANSGASTS